MNAVRTSVEFLPRPTNLAVRDFEYPIVAYFLRKPSIRQA